MHFGLGEADVDSVEIYWPGNLRQVLLKPSSNKKIEVNIKRRFPFSQW